MAKKLAFIITEDNHLNHIAGLIRSAIRKGCDISIFIMDKGVFFTENDEFISITKENNISVAVCEHSCNVNGVASRIDGFNYASQFENAKMINDLKESDRLVKF